MTNTTLRSKAAQLLNRSMQEYSPRSITYAPLLFEDHSRNQAHTKRTSPVEKAQLSDRAKRKTDGKKTEDGYTVSNFRSLLECLSACNLVQMASRTYYSSRAPN